MPLSAQSLSDQPISSPVPIVDVAAPIAPILEIKNLHTYFFTERGVVRAVNGVDLSLGCQSTLGIVGESGCGKSVMSMSIDHLHSAGS